MSTKLQTITPSTGAIDRNNENFDSVSPAGLYGKRPSATTGLTWGYYGGNFNGNVIADGTVALTASSTNYIVAHRTTGAVTAATNTTNWNNQTTYMRLQSIVTGASTITSFDDFRQTYGGAGSGGGSSTFIGLTDVPAAFTGAGGKTVRVNPGATALEFAGGINSQTGTTYTLVAADSEALVIMSNAASNVLTVPPNSAVPLPIGGSVAVQMGGAGVTSIAAGVGVTINTASSLVLAGQTCIAVLTKTATDTWTLTGELNPALPTIVARAKVNFNGTGTVAIRSAVNVSGITDNAIGDFTINFTSAMPNADYAVAFGASNTSSDTTFGVIRTSAAVPTTTALRVHFINGPGTLLDPAYCCVTVF